MIIALIIALFSVSNVEASYSSKSAALQEAPQIIVSADPTMVPPHHYILSNGDSASVEIEENAILYLLEKDRKNYIFDVYKDGSRLATIYPQDKKALIVFGEYRIEIKDLKGNVVSTVYINTVAYPLSHDLASIGIFAGIALLGFSIVWIIRHTRLVRSRAWQRPQHR